MTQLQRRKRQKVAAKKPPLKSAAGNAKLESGSQMGPTNIMHLPDGCLYFVFQRLRCKSDRDSFGLTCLCWLQIQNSSRESLGVSDLLFTGIDPPIDRLLNRFTQLQSLSLSHCKCMTNSLLSQLQQYGSKLHALNLSHCYWLNDYGLYLVAIGCPSLTDINLCWCNITDVGLRVLSKFCLALKDVKLLRCRLVSDHGIRALSQNCRQLRFVCIGMCQRVTGVGFKGCSKTLTCLDARGCQLEPEGILGILSGGGLKYLNVSFVKVRPGRDCLGAIGSAGFAKRLTVLNFRTCKSVNDETIVAVSKGCPLLQEWSLISCHEVKLSGWESIGSNCCNLKRLLVNGCCNLCDQGLCAIRDGCKRLTILHINECARISSTAMEVFKKLRSDVEIKEGDPFSIAPAWVFDDGTKFHS